MPLPQMVRRPLVGGAILWLSGTAYGLWLDADSWLVFSLCIATAALCLTYTLLFSTTRLSSIAVTVALFITAAASANLAQVTRRAEERWLAAYLKEPVSFEGTIYRMVGIRPPGRSRKHPRFPLRNVTISHNKIKYPLRHFKVWVTWYGEGSLPNVGETWSFQTKLPKLQTTRQTSYLALNTRLKDATLLAPPSTHDWRPVIDKTRSSATHRLSLGIEQWPVVPSLIQAMLLGVRSAVPYEINAIFRASGTIHVFAISGLGIGLVATVMVACFSLLGIPRHRWGIPLIPLLSVYTLLTGASPSATRACMMAAIYFGAPLLGRKSDGPTTLSAAAIAQIAWNPHDLQNLSFILSYSAMVGLVLLCRPFAYLCRKKMGVGSSDRLAALLHLAQRLSTLSTTTWQMRWRVRAALLSHKVRLYFADLIAVGIAAWLASIPLTAYYFERFIPGGLLANLVVVPAAFMITVSGALALITSFASDFCAAVFNHSAAFFTNLMILASRGTISIPWASMAVTSPPPYFIPLWYIAMIILARYLLKMQTEEAAQKPQP